jgi:hypothetical protein
MPEVDQRSTLDVIFTQARKAAAGEIAPPSGKPGRYVVLVTPGRLIMFLPCPPPGSMAEGQVAAIEKLISSQVKRNIAVVAYTELIALRANFGRAIPFMGLLVGLAYIGHAVWVFEGHSSALAAGCREADVLLVDGGMQPFLREDWVSIASQSMRRAVIYTHDRQTFSLNQIAVQKPAG